jgi:Zn finger protein HypA/HybF involved in hydrogenase expression
MHEAGLAASVAEAIRTNRLDREGPPLRLVVRGGHTSVGAFDASLLMHLSLCLPELDPARVTIVHAARPAACPGCGSSFTATTMDDACPSCGGPALVPPTPESVVLEWTDEAGASCA